MDLFRANDAAADDDEDAAFAAERAAAAVKRMEKQAGILWSSSHISIAVNLYRIVTLPNYHAHQYHPGAPD